MKIGLYFGSFNPIHNGHLIIANYIANNSDIQKIWFIVSPQNPLKHSSSLLNEYDRLHLVQLAVEDDLHFLASDIEFKLPKPSYTIDTLIYLGEKYPKHEFVVIMGSDSFQNLPKWKNFPVLLRDYSFIVYNRPGFIVDPGYNARVTLLQAPLLELSSTFVRTQVKEGKSIRYYVPDKVANYIETNGYYRN